MNISKILVLLLAIGIIVVIGDSITNLNIPGGLKIESGNGYTQNKTSPGEAMNGPDLSYIFPIVFYTIVAIGVVGFFVYLKYVLKEALYYAAAAPLIILVFYTLLFLVNRVNMEGGAGGNAELSEPYNLSFLFFYIITGFFMGIMVFAIIRAFKVKGMEKKEKIDKKEYGKYVDRAIYHVKLGDDIRGSILRAYREMEKMMRKRGVVDRDYYTPREFESFAFSKLNLSREPVEELTKLFEFARYSSREMDEDDRNAALKSLEMIKNELEE